MSDLGDLLILLHDAGLRCRTVQADGRTWYHADRARAAADRTPAFEEAGEPPGADAAPPAPVSAVPGGPAERVTAWRALFERPDRARLERDRPGGDFGSPVVLVDDGVVRTMLRPGERPAVVADRRRPAASPPGLAPLTGPLFDPSALLGAFRFTVTGREEAAGRPALAATAVRTRAVPASQTGLPRGADELELLVDAEFGVLLRLVCSAGGEAFEVHQVRAIAFDEPIPPGSFEAPPVAAPAPAAAEPVEQAPVEQAPVEQAPVEQAPVTEPVAAAEPAPVPEPVPVADQPEVRAEPAPPAEAPAPETAGETAGEAVDRLQPVSLEEAVRKAGFPVLLPRKVPDGPRLRILLGASATNPSVQLHYQFQAPTHHLRLDERPVESAGAAAEPEVAFERRTHRGQELDVWEGPDGARAARVERAGVVVRLDTDLDLDTLLDVATSLVPVRVSRSPQAARPPAPARKP